MILLIGSQGRIGTRYRAILKFLNVPFISFDAAESKKGIEAFQFDKAIIASPTSTHSSYCFDLLEKNIPFLCEKPLTKDLESSKVLMELAERKKAKAFVVNNWEFALKSFEPLESLSYNYFNTGPDGVEWDLCQLKYIAWDKNVPLEIGTTSPTWDVFANGVEVSYRKIERSYIQMIEAFLKENHSQLWDLRDGYEMTRAVLRKK